MMDCNNDPTTSFADIQEVLRITESLISLRLKGGDSKVVAPVKSRSAAKFSRQWPP
jgi:hypothetical protein